MGGAIALHIFWAHFKFVIHWKNRFPLAYRCVCVRFLWVPGGVCTLSLSLKIVLYTTNTSKIAVYVVLRVLVLQPAPLVNDYFNFVIPGNPLINRNPRE